MTFEHLNIFNPLFTLFSLIALGLSLWLHLRKRKRKLKLIIRLSLIGGSALSLLASMVPYITQVLAVSFLPAAVYNLANPLTLAPFFIGIIGFIACWSVLILLQEFQAMIHRKRTFPRVATTITAIIVIAMMLHALRIGSSGYFIVLNSQQITQYALTGTNPTQLKEIYRESVTSGDQKLNEDILSFLALNPHSPSDLLKTIYARTAYIQMNASSQNQILLNLTKNPNTPADILEKMLTSAESRENLSSSSLALIPHNPNFSNEILTQLSDYPDCEIRRAIISYPHISETILTQMIKKDPDMGVRRDAKRRLAFLHGISHLDESKTPPETNPDIEQTGLEDRATKTYDSNQLKHIFDEAENNADPDIILENLASNCFINADLARDIFAKTALLKEESRFQVLVALAANPKTPSDILIQLANLNEIVILRALAGNPNLPNQIIAQLAPYPDCKVRKRIICHPNATSDILSQLQNDPDQSVSLESAARMKQSDLYLQSCHDIKKLNPSCQRYYDNNNNVMQLYPNTTLNHAFDLTQPLFSYLSFQTI